LLSYQNTNFRDRKPPKRIGNLHPNIVPYQPFRTSDGDVILACGNDNLFRKFCDGGRCQRSRGSAFRQHGKRVENRAEITHLLQDIFTKEKPRSDRAARRGGVPERPINDIAQVFADPQCNPAAFAIGARAPDRRKLPMVASPMRFSGTPWNTGWRRRCWGPIPTRSCVPCWTERGADPKLRADGVI